MATTIPRVVTYEEWLRMPEVQDGIEEVVNGEIRVMPPPKARHTRIVERMAALLRGQLDSERFEMLIAAHGIVIRVDPLSVRNPDLSLFRKAGLIEMDEYFHSAPELVVEVLSPANTRRKRLELLDDYASLGVPEVWIISPTARTIEVLQLEDGKLRSVHIAAQGPLRPIRCPEAAVEVSSIWPD